jgi:hypothetical protein
MAIEPMRIEVRAPLRRMQCACCKYGVSCQNLPERCPMCGGSVWEHEPWGIFSRAWMEADGPRGRPRPDEAPL